MYKSMLNGCGSNGRPRYQQVGGQGFLLWSDDDGWWYSTADTSERCAARWNIRQFYGRGVDAESPDQVAAGTWRVTNAGRTWFWSDNGLKVTECGKP